MVTILIEKLIKRFHSLRWTLLVTYLLIGLLPLLFFANTTLKTMDKYFVEERKKELLSQANVVSGQITDSNYLFDVSKRPLFDQSLTQSSQDGNYRIIVVDSSGVVVNDSNNREIGKTYLIPEVVEALDSNSVAREQVNGTIYASVPIIDYNSNCVGAVLISALATDISVTMGDIQKQINLLLMAIIAIVGIIVFLLSQVFTGPLKSMLSVIKKMSDGHLEQRVPVNPRVHNEIADLAIACNNMADKLELVETTRQHFVSNVSHELKTPLSSIKVLSESVLLQPDVPKETYVEFLRDINSEVDRMTAIINDLLTLVRLDQKEIPANFQTTNLNKLIESIVKRLSPLAKNKDIDVSMEFIKEVKSDTDAMKLSLAFSNLVENAIKYTNPGGSVKITLDCDHQNAFFTVSDTGIGIAENEIGKIFERFYRVDKTRDRETGGTGLGLAITHSTVLIHNGSIKVTSKEGEGTTFLVRIPLHQN